MLALVEAVSRRGNRWDYGEPGSFDRAWEAAIAAADAEDAKDPAARDRARHRFMQAALSFKGSEPAGFSVVYKAGIDAAMVDSEDDAAFHRAKARFLRALLAFRGLQEPQTKKRSRDEKTLSLFGT